MTDKEKEMKKKASNFMIDNDMNPSKLSPMDAMRVAMEMAEGEALERLKATHLEARKLIQSYEKASTGARALFGASIMEDFFSNVFGSTVKGLGNAERSTT